MHQATTNNNFSVTELKPPIHKNVLTTQSVN